MSVPLAFIRPFEQLIESSKALYLDNLNILNWIHRFSAEDIAAFPARTLPPPPGLWPVSIICHALFSLILGCLAIVVRASCSATLDKPTEKADISHGLEILSCLPGVLFLIWRLLILHFAEVTLVKLKICSGWKSFLTDNLFGVSL